MENYTLLINQISRYRKLKKDHSNGASLVIIRCSKAEIVFNVITNKIIILN